MPNNSSTGGYISPVVPSSALFDTTLDVAMHDLVADITGLDTNLVRPRWQPGNPVQPEPTIDWCAIGVTEIDPTDYPAEIHDGTGDGSDTQQQWEAFMVLASFYGPNSMSNASLLRRGLYVAQNREGIIAQGIDLVGVEKITTAPELVNQQWRQRRDMPIRFRRKVESIYPVLNLLLAPDTIVTDSIVIDSNP